MLRLCRSSWRVRAAEEVCIWVGGEFGLLERLLLLLLMLLLIEVFLVHLRCGMRHVLRLLLLLRLDLRLAKQLHQINLLPSWRHWLCQLRRLSRYLSLVVKVCLLNTIMTVMSSRLTLVRLLSDLSALFSSQRALFNSHSHNLLRSRLGVLLRKDPQAIDLLHAVRAGLDMGIVNAGQLAVYEDIPAELLELVEDVLFDRRPDATDRLAGMASALRELNGT